MADQLHHTAPDFSSSSPLPCHQIDIREMYNLANKNDGSWGIEGYKTPKQYLDARELKEAKNPEKKKSPKPTKRGDFITDLIKVSSTIPSPNQYNIVKPWVDDTKKPGPPKNVPKRTTILEEIGIEAKRRPVPGVGAYNLIKDEKDAKKQASPTKQGAERTNFLFDYEYLSNSMPGPGNYNPREVQPKLREAKVKPEDWIKKHNEQLKSPKRNIAPDVGAYSPQPSGFDTFDTMLAKHIAQKGSSKVKTFGNEVRFESDKKKKRTDLSPGPGQYDMVPNWSNQSPKGKPGEKKDQNWMNKITTGISKSIYYS